MSSLAVSGIKRAPRPLPIEEDRSVPAKPLQNSQLHNNSTAEDTGAKLAKNVVCSAIRAAGRQVESTVDAISDNSFVRVPFRFLTEVIRNGSSASVQNILENKKVSSKVWIEGVKKGLENTAATVVFEPNRYSNSLARVGAGFVNMLIRFTARLGMVALEVISPEEISFEGMPDELATRSIGRIIKPFSDNPMTGLLTRFAEQLVINVGLDKMFVKNRILPVIKEKITGNHHLEAKPVTV